MARYSIWEQLWESTEGPNVTIEIPRQWAEELLRAISTALEIEDGGGDIDLDEPHMEPDEDDLDGDSDGDDDDDAMDLILPAGDDDEDDIEEEGADPERDGNRPETALGEAHIGFKKLKGKLAKQGAKNPGGLAYSIGAKKYGKAGMAKKAAAGRKK